jgi:signal transduction histidine kinase
MVEKINFAAAITAISDQIHKENEFVASNKLFSEIFGGLGGIYAVMDNNRQIIYANNDFLDLFGAKTLDEIVGKRLGEVVSCLHSGDESLGCGTSEACSYCGAVNAIFESQKTLMKSTKETRITTVVDEKLRSFDLNLTSSPITLSENKYYIITIEDISSEKRRSALERIFFHDLLNSVGGLNGLLSILTEGRNPEELPDLLKLSEEASREILDEIILHKHIRAAEDGDLRVNIESVNSMQLLESSIGKISFHKSGQNKQVTIAVNSANVDFETDRILLQRVIINMIKNALEATLQTESVIVGIKDKGDKISLWVKNDMVIPTDVQMQMFQRSFSTKGQGRGIGTYSIRLLSENYLKGKVSFISNETIGTVFSIDLNKVFDE